MPRYWILRLPKKFEDFVDNLHVNLRLMHHPKAPTARIPVWKEETGKATCIVLRLDRLGGGFRQVKEGDVIRLVPYWWFSGRNQRHRYSGEIWSKPAEIDPSIERLSQRLVGRQAYGCLGVDDRSEDEAG